MIDRRTPSKEHLEVIRDSVILPIMLTMLEQSKGEIGRSSFSLKNYYVSVAEALMNRIHSDLVSRKKTLRENNIKVIEDGASGPTLRYRYIYGGYEDQFVIMRELIKAEIGIRIGKYAAEIFKRFSIKEKPS